ncbi:MAG TPA: aminotransferase class V-fold PLP-dependent enzyme [Sphingomonas sp.]
MLGATMAAGALAVPAAALAEAVPAGGAAPDDEAYWRGVAAQFDLPKGIVQLENGNWGAMARPVLAAYQRKLARVNTDTSFYSRRGFGADAMAVRDRVAADLGAAPDEIAFTRGATEALHCLIGGYNRLRPGDQLLYADLDYDSMQTAFRSVARRRGIAAIKIDLPEPATHQGVIDAYAAALAAHPKVRLMLLTHVSHRTGLVMPVREIVAMARTRGVDVIVDSAHAWGQLDFKLADLGADFVGFTCQKWIGAPLGVGVMHIRRDRLDAIDFSLGEDPGDRDTIQQRIHTGTTDMAALLTVSDALDFHQRIGVRAKQARLGHLRDHWAEQARGLPGIEVLTPGDPRMICALTSFRMTGRTSIADNRALAKQLLDRFGIFTVDRDGPARGACIRVTPGIFTSSDDVERLVTALRTLSRS